jgi:hypothetical protein
VPQSASTYDYQSAGASRFIGYGGAFWVDSVSAALLRLEVHTASMPHETGVCEAATTVDFRAVAIAGNDYLLPSVSRTEISALPGHYVNNSSYAACREYRSESVIRYEGAGSMAATASASQTEDRSRLQRGVPLVFVLNDDVDTRSAAAGDAVRAHLLVDAVDKKSKRVIAPAGTIARGRIVRLEHQWTPPTQFLIAIEWRSLTLNGAAVPFSASLDKATSSFVVSAADLAQSAGAIRTRNISGGRALIFHTTDENYVVVRGFQSKWVTR